VNPEGFDSVAACIPMGVVKISIVGKMKADDLFDTMLKGTSGHKPFVIIIFTHKG
jgi:hypothetical protein